MANQEESWEKEFDKEFGFYLDTPVESELGIEKEDYEAIKSFINTLLERVIDESYDLWKGDYLDYGNNIQQLKDKYGIK